HATLYLPNKTLLSESIATFVGDEMARDYLKDTYGESSRQYRVYVAQKERGAHIAQALHDTFVELQKLYTSQAPAEDKLRRKGDMLMQLRMRLGLRVAVNNALLMEYRSYTSGQSALAVHLARFGRDWPAFIRWLLPLGKANVADNMEKALRALD